MLLWLLEQMGISKAMQLESVETINQPSASKAPDASEERLLSIIEQAKQLSPQNQQRLAGYLAWLAHQPQPLVVVGHHLADIRCYRDRILAIAQRHGADNLRLFGSVARGDARPDSDVDFLVDVNAMASPWFPAELGRELEQLLGRPVDIVTIDSLHDSMRESVLREAISL